MSTERETSAHQGRPGIAGQRRVPTDFVRLSGVTIEAAHHLCGGCHQPIKAEPRSRERGWPGIARGRQILLKLSELGGSGSSCGVHENPECVAKPVKQPCSKDLLIGKCEQTRPQCQQIGREVPAVHRRDVRGWQRFQRQSIIPVVEVALVAFHGFHSAEGISRALNELPGRKCSRSHKRTNSQAAQAPCWSGTCDARPRQQDALDNYQAAANDLPDRRTSRRTPRSSGKASEERWSGQPSVLLRGGRAAG